MGLGPKRDLVPVRIHRLHMEVPIVLAVQLTRELVHQMHAQVSECSKTVCCIPLLQINIFVLFCMTNVYLYVYVRVYIHVQRMSVVHLTECARCSVFVLKHDILLRTSYHYGIRETVLQWFLLSREIFSDMEHNLSLRI